jgi:hypothetical protein
VSGRELKVSTMAGRQLTDVKVAPAVDRWPCSRQVLNAEARKEAVDFLIVL